MEMKFSLLEGGEDGEHNGIGVVEIFKVLAIRDVVFC